MQITNIKIRAVHNQGNFKAGISATLNDLSVNDMKLMQGQNGMFISMPSRKYLDANGKEKYSDIVYLQAEQKKELLETVLSQMDGQASITPQQVQAEISHVISDEPFNDMANQFDGFGETVELNEDDIAF